MVLQHIAVKIHCIILTVFRIPVSPSVASSSSCVPMGPVGMALNGVVIFNPLSIELAHALTCEFTDNCVGHPNGAGRSHVFLSYRRCQGHNNNPRSLLEYYIHLVS